MNVSMMIRVSSIVLAAGSLIAVSTLSGCAGGQVSGTANVNTGLINGTVQFQGTWGTPQGATTQIGHTTFKGKVYPVYKDANGEIYIFVEGQGYLLIEHFVTLHSQGTTQGAQATPNQGTVNRSPGGGGSEQDWTPYMSLQGVSFTWDDTIQQAQLDFPAFPGMVLPNNPGYYGVSVDLYDAGGGAMRVLVTGFENGVSLYGLNSGLYRMDIPANALHNDLTVQTDATWVTVQNPQGKVIGRMQIVATSIDDPQTAGIDEVRFLTAN